MQAALNVACLMTLTVTMPPLGLRTALLGLASVNLMCAPAYSSYRRHCRMSCCLCWISGRRRSAVQFRTVPVAPCSVHHAAVSRSRSFICNCVSSRVW